MRQCVAKAKSHSTLYEQLIDHFEGDLKVEWKKAQTASKAITKEQLDLLVLLGNRLARCLGLLSLHFQIALKVVDQLLVQNALAILNFCGTR